MTRRLLPYEHQLIRELKISEDEYLNFLQAQFDYTRTPEEKLQEISADFGLTALIVTVVGVLFQVGAALLAPKPQLPSMAGQRQRREERFAPRFGFNSTQDLAKYGDPVNLVYCNTSQNTTGGVRVATSLIWSAVSSYGSSQFMQSLLVLGASRINAIDFTRMAFGQTPIRQFITQKAWTYFNAAGNIRFSDVQTGDTKDPTRTNSGDLVYRANTGGNWEEGFSQAFSPTTLNKCGVYAPIPLNVNITERDGEGDTQSQDLGITVDDAFKGTYWVSPRRLIPIGAQMTVKFQNIELPTSASDIKQSAADQRLTLLSSIDAASTYKLGSAKFKLAQQLLSSDLENQNVSVVFECIEPGYCPAADYGTKTIQQSETEWRRERSSLRQRNNEIDAILLNPPTILAPITITNTNVSGDLVSIQTTKDQLQDWIEDIRGFRRARRTNPYQDNRLFVEGLAQSALTDPIVAEIANEIITLEDQLEDTDNKDKRKAIKRQIKRTERELNRAIDQYGIVEGFVFSPRTGLPVNGRQEIKTIKRLLNAKDLEAWQKILGAVSVSGGGRDFAAEQARDSQLQNEKTANLARIAELDARIEDPNSWDDYFNTKCLVKIEEAAYEVITSPRVINFSLKAKVFQRIAGRAKDYGKDNVKQFKASDNGYTLRTCMFWLLYRSNATEQFRRFPYVFAIRRGADNDSFVDLRFVAGSNGGKWQFRFEPIAETPAEFLEYQSNPPFAYLENNGPLTTITNTDGTAISFAGRVKTANGNLPRLNNTPFQVDEWGLFSARSDTQITYSFESGPEITISAVTEQQVESLSTYPQLYSNLSLLGFNAYSGQGMQDLRSITAFVTQGKLVRQLNDDGTYSATADTASSLAPEIFLDTILDNVDGIGQFAKVGGIDTKLLAKAKQFCLRNNLFFDGVIAQQTSWRQFWAEVAPFSLLELGRIGGKETLLPAVPCDNAGNITRTVPISAMFTAGNILEDTYKEEHIDYGSSVQDLIASVIYRDTEADGVFPRNRSVDVCLVGVTETTGVRQTFDLSDYVTNRAQAILFAKLLCNQRRHIRRNIEFRTFPTDSPLSPGAYIYVDMGQQDWQGIYSGQVETGGALNVPLTERIPDGTYNVLLYRSGQAVVSTSVTITSNVSASLATYAGWLFVLGTAVKAKRVFRVVEVQMDEEGEVNVRATEHPCDTSGLSLIADFTDSLFTVR